MKIKYFQDTDTLYIELRAAKVAETNDVDENTLLDLDENGKICGITIEHAADRVDLPNFNYLVGLKLAKKRWAGYGLSLLMFLQGGSLTHGKFDLKDRSLSRKA